MSLRITNCPSIHSGGPMLRHVIWGAGDQRANWILTPFQPRLHILASQNSCKKFPDTANPLHFPLEHLTFCYPSLSNLEFLALLSLSLLSWQGYTRIIFNFIILHIHSSFYKHLLMNCYVGTFEEMSVGVLYIYKRD